MNQHQESNFLLVFILYTHSWSAYKKKAITSERKTTEVFFFFAFIYIWLNKLLQTNLLIKIVFPLPPILLLLPFFFKKIFIIIFCLLLLSSFPVPWCWCLLDYFALLLNDTKYKIIINQITCPKRYWIIKLNKIKLKYKKWK